jgi:hypothetical protein
MISRLFNKQSITPLLISSRISVAHPTRKTVILTWSLYRKVRGHPKEDNQTQPNSRWAYFIFICRFKSDSHTQASVRKHLLTLIPKPRLLTATVLPDELAAYDAKLQQRESGIDDVEATTIDAFQIDITGTPMKRCTCVQQWNLISKRARQRLLNLTPNKTLTTTQ